MRWVSDPCLQGCNLTNIKYSSWNSVWILWQSAKDIIQDWTLANLAFRGFMITSIVLDNTTHCYYMRLAPQVGTLQENLEFSADICIDLVLSELASGFYVVCGEVKLSKFWTIRELLETSAITKIDETYGSYSHCLQWWRPLKFQTVQGPDAITSGPDEPPKSFYDIRYLYISCYFDFNLCKKFASFQNIRNFGGYKTTVIRHIVRCMFWQCHSHDLLHDGLR